MNTSRSAIYPWIGARLYVSADAQVTVRIEEEGKVGQADSSAEPFDDPAFGIWRDHQDMTDVEAYIRKLRAPRFTRD